MSIQEVRIDDLPLYNDDVHRAGDPAPVARLRAQLKSAHAVLLVSPEYNFSMPGVLKNVLDWVSRPPNALDGMPVALMGASIGPLGTARAQYHLRQVLQCLNAFPAPLPSAAGGMPEAGGKSGRRLPQLLRSSSRPSRVEFGSRAENAQDGDQLGGAVEYRST